MPWCEACAKFWNPSSMTADGACPTCGRVLERPSAPVADPASPGGDEPAARVDPKRVDVKALAGEEGKAPWHFKLLVGLTAAYLLWRVWELIAGAL